MTAEKSIKILKAVKELKDDAIYTLADLTEAYKMAIEALSNQSVSSDQTDKAWEMLMGVHDMPDVPDEAKDIIGDVMLMLHQMIVRADESIITDFVAYQREQLRSHKIMELNSVDEAMTHIFLRKTGKAYIEYLDRLGQFEVKPGKNGEDRTKDDEGPKLFGKRTIIEPGEQFIGENLLKEALDQSADSDKMVDQFRDTTKKTEDDEGPKLFLLKGTLNQCGDGAKMIDLKKRTITERLIIANSLIAGAIADSDNNQFRDSAKKTDSERVSLLEQEKSNSLSNFKPGDKFILELGQERRMFGEFEIKGTDLYVKTSLLEKLKRYEPEVKTEKIPYKKPEIIDIAKVTMAMAKGADMVPVTRCKDCKYSVNEYNEGDCYCRRPQKALEYVGDWNFFCGAADRKEK